MYIYFFRLYKFKAIVHVSIFCWYSTSSARLRRVGLSKQKTMKDWGEAHQRRWHDMKSMTWKNQCTNGWVSEWVGGWVSDWVSERVSEWANEWGTDWLTGWLTDWSRTQGLSGLSDSGIHGLRAWKCKWKGRLKLHENQNENDMKWS